MNKRNSLIIVIITLVGGVFFGFLIGINKIATQDNNSKSVRQGGYMYINPLLECEVDGGWGNKSLKDYKQDINKIINQKIKQDPINHISVYFRDLNNGPWFGINEKENFAPASLLKTPLMITYYKKEEANPGYLNNKLEFTPEIASIYGSNPETALLTIGQSYTIDELINNMIIESDNNSFDTLIQNIDFNEIKQVHIDLGLTVPDQQTPDDFITVKEYASLFRVLFNASYLNRAMSEKALSLLSQATFDQGIAAGLPQGTTIANKFGIKTIAENQEKQLHDCGIIYYPNHPYLLCIMTRGNDLNELTRTIREISSAVYQQIDSQYNN